MIRLSHLFIYPIKSTAPVELETAQVAERGLLHDRRYLLTDAEGRFFTARRLPRMLLIKAVPDGDQLRVTAPGMPPLQVDSTAPDAAFDPVVVWKDTFNARHCQAADAWFSQFLGVETRLYYMSKESVRPARDGGEVSFADAAPLLLLSEGSVDELNQRLEKPVSLRNFRPNLVVSGITAHAEDQWAGFRIGPVELKVMWPCSRCILTTIDPETAVPDASREPLVTLMKYRKVEKDALFGVNSRALGTGSINTGDEVRPILKG